MFLKSLTIDNNGVIVRKISFHKGLNLIVDETKTSNRKESGNNVGKTTVLRLIDFCLGGKGENIYNDPEFKEKGSNNIVKEHLKDKNVTISLVLKEDLEIKSSEEIIIRRNFLNRKEKIQEINGESFNNTGFLSELKRLIFKSVEAKPTFRQIIAKNIRDEKNRLLNTVKVLHPTTTQEEYEALYLFWLGVDINNSDRKQKLTQQIKIERDLQKRLRKDSNLSQLEQALIVLQRNIAELENKKNSFNLNEEYNEDLDKLNKTKSTLTSLSTKISRLEIRKELILESKSEIEKEIANINTKQIETLYKEAKLLIPNLQKNFEDTLTFHNDMLKEKSKYLTKELPEIAAKIRDEKRRLDSLLSTEKEITEKLHKSGAIEDLQIIITDLNLAYERKGNIEEQKRMWEDSINKLEDYENELEKINSGINSLDETIKERVIEFNKFFSKISNDLYGEQFYLSPDKNEKGYELNISTITGNLGTGKKKGQIAAFDLAYIQFAESLGVDCIHFILHDQIENVHDNQITSLLNEVVARVNCQYIIPVLRDKLPSDIDVSNFEVLTLSQNDKLFKIESTTGHNIL